METGPTDSKKIFDKLDPERYPHMSERLVILVNYLFADSTGDREIDAIKISETGEVFVQRASNPDTLDRLGLEAELGEQLRRLAAVAGLTREERKEYEDLVLRRLGISLALRFSCHSKL